MAPLHGTGGIQIGLRGLRMAGCVLHLGAHPDDEDIGLIAYVARKHGARAVYWSATRGEGGQNHIGPYSGVALGVYRTWESEAARVGDGGECLFGPFFDFGFSKTADEALGRWGMEAMVREIVRAIRTVQPDVIVARWQGNEGDFHGQHQAVGKAAKAAFSAAADPARFPELELPAWQTLKYYESLDNSGGDQSAGGACNFLGRANPDFEQDGCLRLNTGEFDPAAGLTYQQQAWVAYNRHQTQAMGIAPNAGDFFYYFRRHASVVPTLERETDFYEGFDPTLRGLSRLAAAESRDELAGRLKSLVVALEAAELAFRPASPRTAVLPLLDALDLLRELAAMLGRFAFDGEGRLALMRYLSRKEDDIQRLVAYCAGVEAECTVLKAKLIPGETVRATARLWNHAGDAVELGDFYFIIPPGWRVRPADDGNAGPAREFDIEVAPAADISCPYWLAHPRVGNTYVWADRDAAGLPFAQPPVRMVCNVRVMGRQLAIVVPVVQRQAFPGGYRELPLSVLPPILLYPKIRKEFLQATGADQTLEVQVVARCAAPGGARGVLALDVPAGWGVVSATVAVGFTQAGEAQTTSFIVMVPGGCGAGNYRLDFSIECGGRRYALILDPVRMGPAGIPRVPDESNCIREEMIASPAAVAINVIDAKLFPNLSYAYVKGADEQVIEALEHFDLKFHLLDDNELGHGDLSRFDVIVIGPNAYLVREALRANARRLLDYVEAGGTLVVQFQGYGYARPGLAPYPFSYSNPHDRVTWEAAPVTMLQSDDDMFAVPNCIGPEDFDGWVHDRGMYFFGERDKRYTPLLSCHDPDEPPCDGGLLVTSYGKGTYVYTGYSFHRQLPEGVAGAFRLFANILAVPMTKLLRRAAMLRGVGLFAPLSTEQMQEVARIAVERWDDAGTYLCHEGDNGAEMLVVLAGEVEIIKESAGGRVVYVAQPGEAIGELAILGCIPRTAAMRAKGDLHCMVIRGDYFHALMRNDPDLTDLLIRSLVLKLAATT